MDHLRAVSRSGRWRTLRTVFLTAALVALGARPARADVEQCVAAAYRAQELRDQAQLVASREQLLLCARDACPAVIQRDCFVWLKELDELIPTFIVVVRDAAGRDVPDARILVDGAAVGTPSGRPLQMNPGRHLVRVENGSSSAEETVLAYEQDKGRRLVLTLKGAQSPAPPSSSSSVSSAPASSSPVSSSPDASSSTSSTPGRSIPPLSFVLGGVGVLGVAGFAYFFSAAVDEARALEGRCTSQCTDDQLSAVRTQNVIADISLGIGAAALVGAVVVYFAQPTRAKTTGVAASSFRGLTFRF
jgi:hypothetical protein